MGQIWSFFGPKILNFTGGTKSSGTHLSENHCYCFIGRAWHQMYHIGQYDQNDQKYIFLAKFGRYWAKILIFTGGSKSFGTHMTEKPHGHLIRIVCWLGRGSNGPKMPIVGPKWQKCMFGAKFGLIWAKKFFGGRGSKLLVQSYHDIREPLRNLFHLENIDR